MRILWALQKTFGRGLLIANALMALPPSATDGFAEEQKLGRIASVNLCADQLLVALASADRVAALGPFARDSNISFFSSHAQKFATVSGRSEDLLSIQVDAIAVGPFDNKFMRAMLARRSIKVITVEQWTSLAGVRRGVQTFAEQIGETDKGAELVSEIDTALIDLDRLANRLPMRSFLVLHRRGFVGQADIVAEILERAGLTNSGRNSPMRFLSVEAVIAERADFLVVTGRDLKAEDRGLELLEHPALRRLYPDERRITAPDHLTICAGPATPDLIRHLIRELETRIYGP